MFRPSSVVAIAFVLMAAFSIWTLGSTDALAQCGSMECQHGSHAGHDHGSHGGGQHGDHAGQDHADHAGHDHGGGAPMAQHCPHGGQMTMAGPHRFEVVYRPEQTRVFLYGSDRRPMSMRGVQGRMLMHVRGHDKIQQRPLEYVASQTGSGGHDHAAAEVDVSRIKDGDMMVTFELDNLPDRRQPQASFAQTFALSKIPVALALLDESDGPRIERQKVCPVLGGPLGSMGTPVKVLVGDQPMYLCCKGCVSKVRENPELYLKKVGPSESQTVGKSSADQITIATATSSDQKNIAEQGSCPVLGGRLGAMGTPTKITINGQTLFVCCKGCVAKVVDKPDQYLAKAAELRKTL